MTQKDTIILSPISSRITIWLTRGLYRFAFESNTAVAEPQPGMDYSAHDLEDLGRNDQRTRRIIELAEDVAVRHPRTIVFCPSVESALECDKHLNAKGVTTGVVTGKYFR